MEQDWKDYRAKGTDEYREPMVENRKMLGTLRYKQGDNRKRRRNNQEEKALQSPLWICSILWYKDYTCTRIQKVSKANQSSLLGR